MPSGMYLQMTSVGVPSVLARRIFPPAWFRRGLTRVPACRPGAVLGPHTANPVLNTEFDFRMLRPITHFGYNSSRRDTQVHTTPLLTIVIILAHTPPAPRGPGMGTILMNCQLLPQSWTARKKKTHSGRRGLYRARAVRVAAHPWGAPARTPRAGPGDSGITRAGTPPSRLTPRFSMPIAPVVLLPVSRRRWSSSSSPAVSPGTSCTSPRPPGVRRQRSSPHQRLRQPSP